MHSYLHLRKEAVWYYTYPYAVTSLRYLEIQAEEMLEMTHIGYMESSARMMRRGGNIMATFRFTPSINPGHDKSLHLSCCGMAL